MQKRDKNKYVYELLFVLLSIVTLFTGLSLFSYNSSDPSYSNVVFSRYDENVSNIFGKAGAYTADILGTAFGWVALLIPFALIYVLVNIARVYKGRFSRIKAAGGITSFFLLLITLSVLTRLIAETDPFFTNKTGGGILGIMGATLLLGVLGRAGSIILCMILTVLWILGVVRISVTELAAFISSKFSNNKDNGRRKRRSEKNPLLPKIGSVIGAFFSGIGARWREHRAERRIEKEKRDSRDLEEMLERAKEDDAFFMREAAGVKDSVQPRYDTELEKDLSDIYINSDNLTPNTGTVEPLNIIPPYVIEPERSKMSPEDITVESGVYEGLELPNKDELLTVSQLEEILAVRENAALAGMEEETVQRPEQIIGMFDELVRESHHVERAPSNVRNIITGGNYNLSFELLEPADPGAKEPDIHELREKADMLLGKLKDFGVNGRIREIRPGPVVTLFELEPAPGVKISKIASLENDLALAMSAISIRIIAPIPGKAAVGIEIPNEHRVTVKLRELLETKDFKQSESPLVVAFGKDISGRPYYSDLRTMPHLLVAGTTGSGKSVCINTIICSILYKSSPDAVKFVMIDPKMVELSVYNGIPHLAAPVVTDPRKASAVLNNVVKEMEARYKLLSECGVRNIESYGKYIKSHADLEPMPYMVVIVDEFGDLMMVAGKEVESAIIRIAQLARAVGIHLVLATQRPSVNVITGIIKANMPARISFRVSSKIDSRTILDQNGAELLLGRGDSLFIPPGTSYTSRIHGCFVSEEEVKNIVTDLKRYGEPVYNMALLEEPTPEGSADGEDLDPLYEDALRVAREKGAVSISMIQRYLKIGYNRAARIVEAMEYQGLIPPSDGTSRPREFLGRD